MPVISVTEDQVQDSVGNLSDVFTVVFTVADLPQQYTVQVPQGGDPVAAARQAIDAKTAEVQGILAL